MYTNCRLNCFKLNITNLYKNNFQHKKHKKSIKIFNIFINIVKNYIKRNCMAKGKKRFMIAYGLMLSSIVVAAESTILALHFTSKKNDLTNESKTNNNEEVEADTINKK